MERDLRVEMIGARRGLFFFDRSERMAKGVGQRPAACISSRLTFDLNGKGSIQSTMMI